MSAIQFTAIIKDNKGEDAKGPDGTVLTLGRACEIALDSALDTDRNEGLKPKLRRGRLIDEISTAEKDAKPLALEAGDIELLKDRIGHAFITASFVRRVCLMLDPATKE